MAITDELVRIGAFQSKTEARTMIKNNGVSIMPCVNEDFEVPCFNIEEDEHENWKFIEPVNVNGKTVNQFFNKGFILTPDGKQIPARLWDVRDCNIELLSFREHLMHDTAHNDFFSFCIENPNAGCEYFNLADWDDKLKRPKKLFKQNATMAVITWDKSFGKNPWLLTDPNAEITIKPGDVVKIGKRRTIVVE